MSEFSPQSMSRLSLPIRMEQKRRRARAGVAALVPGVVLIALSVYAFSRGGAEVLGIWAVGLGLGLSALGVTLIRRAKNAR